MEPFNKIIKVAQPGQAPTPSGITVAPAAGPPHQTHHQPQVNNFALYFPQHQLRTVGLPPTSTVLHKNSVEQRWAVTSGANTFYSVTQKNQVWTAQEPWVGTNQAPAGPDQTVLPPGMTGFVQSTQATTAFVPLLCCAAPEALLCVNGTLISLTTPPTEHDLQMLLESCESYTGLIKKPHDAFMIWCYIHRPLFFEACPGAKLRSISIHLDHQWKKLSDQQKWPYFNAAHRLRFMHQQKFPYYYKCACKCQKRRGCNPYAEWLWRLSQQKAEGETAQDHHPSTSTEQMQCTIGSMSHNPTRNDIQWNWNNQ